MHDKPQSAQTEALGAPPPACPACGASCSEVRVKRGVDTHHDFLRCPACGLLRRRAFPTSEEVQALYQEAYYAAATADRFQPPFEWLERRFRIWRARRLRRLLPPPPARVLDVGCGRGVFLGGLRNAGYEVHGTQLSRTAAASIQARYGFEVFVGDLPDAPWPAAYFDVITVWHVLEHMPDPARALDCLAGLLRPGGLLIVEVPNAGGWSARLFGWRWLHWDREHHLVHFTWPVLRDMLERRGFEVTRRSTVSIEYGPTAILQSLLNLLPGPENLLFRAVGKTAGARISRRWITLHILALPVLLPLAALLFAVTVLAGEGDVLNVMCRHRKQP